MKFFEEELSYLQEKLTDFESNHTHAAEKLGISKYGTNDPHVVKLLEGFAYISSRIRENTELQHANTAKLILDAIAPSFVRPDPTCCIAHISSKTESYMIDKGTIMIASEKTYCKFTVLYSIEILPLTIVRVVLEEDCIRIDLQSSKLPSITRCVLYINDEHAANIIYAIFKENSGGFIEDRPFDCKILNFNILHENKEPFQAFYEYSIFKRKMMFLELEGLSFTKGAQEESIYIKICKDHSLTQPPSFMLNCVPLINMFPLLSEPINCNGKSTNYKVSPSQRYNEYIQIYSIDKIHLDKCEISKFFSLTRKGNKFWYVTQYDSEHFISIIDSEPHKAIGFAYLSCINKNTAIDIGLKIKSDNMALSGRLIHVTSQHKKNNIDQLWNIVFLLQKNDFINGLQYFASYYNICTINRVKTSLTINRYKQVPIPGIKLNLDISGSLSEQFLAGYIISLCAKDNAQINSFIDIYIAEDNIEFKQNLLDI